MSISTALKARNTEELEAAIEAARKIYNPGELPTEPKIETVHGEILVSAIFDDDTKWAVVASEYTKLASQVADLPKGADVNVETAKLIASSGIFAHITDSGASIGLL